MDYPEDLKYSSEHEWVAVDGNRARVGITDYAQDALGDVVFVSLPASGASVDAGSTCAEAGSDIAARQVAQEYARRIRQTVR